ncbi:DUF4127 family protein [Cronobacter malonaticus]
MKIIAIPLDIRPYNYDFLQSLANMDSRVRLSMPERELLGFKKQAAELTALDAFLNRKAADADALVISLDMYIYGGLFPSRIHTTSLADLLARLEKIRHLKRQYPGLRIYASSLVLRTPRYNSAEEEPDYYAVWGEAIFSYGYLENKRERIGLTDEEQRRLIHHQQTIPDDVLSDWLARREKNRRVIKAAIALVAQGVLEQLVIPLDDTAEYGFTASDQSLIYRWIADAGVQSRVFVHPGTDESGCTLLTRAYLDQRAAPFIISTLCSGDDFFHVIPNYEDRPFCYSLRSHAAACGITLNDGALGVPVLAINGCGEVMQEAAVTSYGYCVQTGTRVTPYKNVTYYTRRWLADFVSRIATISAVVPVVVADLAFSNGGETELIDLLDRENALDRLKGYAGWNTTCNSLGTALATLAFASCGDCPSAVKQFLQERLMYDWAWQTEVRFPVQCEFLTARGGTYADFDAIAGDVFAEITRRLRETWRTHIHRGFDGRAPDIVHISAPFRRLSGLSIRLASVNEN